MLSFISSAPSCSHEICTTSSMYHFGLFSPLFSRSLKLSVQLLYHSTRKEGCTSFKMQPSFFKQYLNFLLAEIPLEQPLERLAVAGFVAPSHARCRGSRQGYVYMFSLRLPIYTDFLLPASRHNPRHNFNLPRSPSTKRHSRDIIAA